MPVGTGDKAIQPLWSSDLYPFMFKLFPDPNSRSAKIFYDICGSLGQSTLNRSKDQGTVTLFSGDPNYELRRYLWDLFHFYQSVTPTPFKLEGWGWSEVLNHLKSSVDLTIISFNYDLNIECVLKRLGYRFTWMVERVVEYLGNREAGRALILKPHGSLNYFSMDDDMMLSIMNGQDNAIISCQFTPFTRVVPYPCNLRPVLSDIVPPGCAGDKYCNPNSDVSSAIASEIVDSDVLLLCGLSATTR